MLLPLVAGKNPVVVGVPIGAWGGRGAQQCVVAGRRSLGSAAAPIAASARLRRGGFLGRLGWVDRRSRLAGRRRRLRCRQLGTGRAKRQGDEDDQGPTD